MNLAPAEVAIKTNLQQAFQASGGVEPYAFAIAPGGAGGSIDPMTGRYTSPAFPGAQPDVITVTDANGATATAKVRVLDVLGLVANIIEHELNLGPNRVWIYNEKVNAPKDSGIFCVLSMVSAKPFGVSNRPSADGTQSVQSVNMNALVQVDIKSKSNEALHRKEEVVLALSSNYAQEQQLRNSFRLGIISSGMQNLSEVDGAGIPYHFAISFNVKYSFSKTKVAPYFDTFANPTLITSK